MKRISLKETGLVIIVAMLFYNADCSKNTSNCHSSFRIKNTGSNAVYFSPEFDSAVSKINYPPGLSPETEKCDGNAEKIYNRRGCYESDVNYFGKLYVFIFDAAVIESTSWETVKQNRLFLKRYDLTKAQLDSCNWVITYP